MPHTSWWDVFLRFLVPEIWSIVWLCVRSVSGSQQLKAAVLGRIDCLVSKGNLLVLVPLTMIPVLSCSKPGKKAHMISSYEGAIRHRRRSQTTTMVMVLQHKWCTLPSSCVLHFTISIFLLPRWVSCILMFGGWNKLCPMHFRKMPGTLYFLRVKIRKAGEFRKNVFWRGCQIFQNSLSWQMIKQMRSCGFKSKSTMMAAR